eukprot:scaffold7470_cov140-Skeletonema_menzelii.AAC.6
MVRLEPPLLTIDKERGMFLDKIGNIARATEMMRDSRRQSFPFACPRPEEGRRCACSFDCRADENSK